MTDMRAALEQIQAIKTGIHRCARRQYDAYKPVASPV
jgi:hypothetical protein